MTTQKKYYAVVAKNGVAVFNSRERFENAKKYLTQPTFRVFHNYTEAAQYAMGKFNQTLPKGYRQVWHLDVNRIIFKNDLQTNLIF